MFLHPSLLALMSAAFPSPAAMRLQHRSPISHRKNARRGWDEPGPTRIRLAQKSLPAGRTSTLRKIMRAAGAK